MWFGILVLLTALSISAVAIYYSVAGLVAIFAAAALPIMIMGGTLEVGKLVTAVWLHRYWKQATWWLKSYLSVAVIVLMLITSMGIFGFLSKAHIEQTAASTESVARAEVLQKEIDRQVAIISRAENQIQQLESTGTGSDANIQAQINAEQERIDKAYERVQPAIDEQQRIIDNQGKLFRDELARVDEQLATLQSYIDAGDIRKAQQMVGARADGSFGPNTAAKFREWQEAQQAKRTELLTKIEQATNNPQARAAANEIKRLRQTVERQIADSNTLINRLRQQIGSTDNSGEIQKSIDEQNERIKNANAEIDTLTQEKISVEAEYRKLEAEVGPIKYIAEFIYGETADTNMLEEAVRWVIIVIIFVFDPLAVLLLIASQYTFQMHRKDDGDRLRLERQEYEQARAQRIVDNPGYNIDDPKEETYETGERNREEATKDVEELLSGQDEESLQTEDGNDPAVAEASQEERQIDGGMDIQPPAAGSVGAGDNGRDTTDRMAVAGIQEGVDELNIEKKDIELLEELEPELEERVKAYEQKEASQEFNTAKASWKLKHPDQTVKFYKTLYIKGKIDSLPWETVDEGYVQNGEQNENTIFNRLQKGDE